MQVKQVGEVVAMEIEEDLFWVSKKQEGNLSPQLGML